MKTNQVQTEQVAPSLLEFARSVSSTKDKKQQLMSPQEAIRNISMIFAEASQNPAHFSPQGKIIILTMTICGTILVMYTIFESFIDTIILAFLSGIAYVKVRERFIRFCKRSAPEVRIKRSKMAIASESLFYAALIFIIPWINYEFSDETTYDSWIQLLRAKINAQTLSKFTGVFFKANNIIKVVQIYLFSAIILNFFGGLIERCFYYVKSLIGRSLLKQFDNEQTDDEIKDRIKSFLHTLFSIIVAISFCLLMLCFAGIAFEFSGMISSAGRAIQRYNNCTLYSLDHMNTKQQCTDVITGTLKPYLPNIKDAKQIEKCIEGITKTEQSYLNFTLFEHKKEICLVYQMVKQYSPQAIDQFFNIQTTKEYLTTILKNVLKLLSMTSNAMFSLTTFISIFMITQKSYSSSETHLHILGQAQARLVSQITNLISDYTMVTTKHIVISLVIFEIFQFSELNIVLSLLIGLVTLFPFISVMMVMTLFCSLKFWFAYPQNHISHLSSIMCLLLFNYGSSRIFQNHFNQMDFNKALVSLSAVFGLYRFGVAGIFYGPLVILLFICAYDAMSKSKI